MALTPQNKVDLLSSARDIWIDAKSHWYAYGRALESSKKISDWLKIGTILSAVLTTATGFAEYMWLTISTGFMTTVLATVERQYVPTENYLKYSECKADLDGVHMQLNSFSRRLDALKDYAAGDQNLVDLHGECIRIRKDSPITLSSDDKKMAEEEFKTSTIALMLDRAKRELDATLPAVVEPFPELPEDALDVVAVSRTQEG